MMGLIGRRVTRSSPAPVGATQRLACSCEHQLSQPGVKPRRKPEGARDGWRFVREGQATSQHPPLAGDWCMSLSPESPGFTREDALGANQPIDPRGALPRASLISQLSRCNPKEAGNKVERYRTKLQYPSCQPRYYNMQHP